jgi:hypothetical protein
MCLRIAERVENGFSRIHRFSYRSYNIRTLRFGYNRECSAKNGAEKMELLIVALIAIVAGVVAKLATTPYGL